MAYYKSRIFGNENQFVPIIAGNISLTKTWFATTESGETVYDYYMVPAGASVDYITKDTMKPLNDLWGDGLLYCFPFKDQSGEFNYAITVSAQFGRSGHYKEEIVDKYGEVLAFMENTTAETQDWPLKIGLWDILSNGVKISNIPIVSAIISTATKTERVQAYANNQLNHFVEVYNSLAGDIEGVKQYQESQTEGGSADDPGELDFHSDVIGMPEDPLVNLGALSGFTNVYEVADTSIKNLLSDFADINDYKNYSEFFISCHIVPVKPNTASPSSIRVADKTLTTQGNPIYNDRVDVDCGSISLKEQYKSFLDYEAVVIKLFLPFIGFVDIKPEWVYESTLSIKYRFNVLDGQCIAFIFSNVGKNGDSGLTTDGTCVATFSGSCKVDIPMSASNYARQTAAIVNTVASTAAGAIGGAVAGAKYGGTWGAVAGAAIGGVASGLSSSVQNTPNMTPSVVQSGSFNGSSSFMSHRTPFLYFEWVKASMPKNYEKRVGYPCNVAYTLSELKGFTVVDRCDLSTLSCTAAERDKIAQALASGIIL